ncbi:MAG: LuxR C-terminal-related transcriptional regulator [Paracoccaceae bacterium]
MENIVKSILNAATQPDSWETVLDDYNAVFDVTASCMITLNIANKQRMNFAWSAFNRAHLKGENLKLMESGNDQGDAPAYQMIMQSPARKFYNDLEMFNVSKYSDLPKSNVRDITESFGLTTRTVSVLNTQGPWMDTIMVQTSRIGEADRFIADRRNDIILPIMAHSIALGQTISALRTQYQAALSVLDNLGLGVFLIDGRGCLINHNKEAQRILDLDDGVLLAAGKQLKARSSEQTRALEVLIARANAPLDDHLQKAPDVLSISRPSGQFPYLVSAQTLSDSTGELETGLKCAFITIIDPNRKNVLSADGLTAMGDLSAAEAAIVDLLVQGYRLNEVSERRDVSLNTVKTQLKGISQKLRCTSQGDIIRAAAATRIPLKK